MQKIKNVKIGDYVLVARWGDKDPHDPWYVGFINEWGEDKRGRFYRVEGSNRYWRHCWRISQEEGAEHLELYGSRFYGLS